MSNANTSIYIPEDEKEAFKIKCIKSGKGFSERIRELIKEDIKK
jgi:hypothetical protein